jgi:hypothetical protein
LHAKREARRAPGSQTGTTALSPKRSRRDYGKAIVALSLLALVGR